MKLTIFTLLIISILITLSIYYIIYRREIIKRNKRIKNIERERRNERLEREHNKFLQCYYIALANDVLKFYDKSKDYYELKYGD